MISRQHFQNIKSYLIFVQKFFNYYSYYFAFTRRSNALHQESYVQDALKWQVKPFSEATINRSSLSTTLSWKFLCFTCSLSSWITASFFAMSSCAHWSNASCFLEASVRLISWSVVWRNSSHRRSLYFQSLDE